MLKKATKKRRTKKRRTKKKDTKRKDTKRRDMRKKVTRKRPGKRKKPTLAPALPLVTGPEKTPEISRLPLETPFGSPTISATPPDGGLEPMPTVLSEASQA